MWKSDKDGKILTAIFDSDDVLYDFIGHVVASYNRLHKTTITEKDLISWELPVELKLHFKKYEQKGLYSSLSPLPHVRNALRYFSEVLNYKVIILTARNQSYYDESFLKLKMDEITFDEIVFKKDKASYINEISSTHRIVSFVDDKLTTVLKVSEKCQVDKVFLLDRPYNQVFKLDNKIIRITDLMETIKPIKEKFPPES